MKESIKELNPKAYREGKGGGSGVRGRLLTYQPEHHGFESYALQKEAEDDKHNRVHLKTISFLYFYPGKCEIQENVILKSRLTHGKVTFENRAV